MIEPKIFYRKLDFLLNKIGQEKSHKDFLLNIVYEIENTFGDDLHIKNGKVYQRLNEDFEIVESGDKDKSNSLDNILYAESEPIKALLKNGTYIFDDMSFSINSKQNGKIEYAIPAALTVDNSEDSWIFIFELKSGWVREEIEFCLNAVRTALNQRLFADLLKNELTQAALIQKSLLPSHAPDFRGYKISGRAQQAELVGGDIFDYHHFDNDVLGVSIGDAGGHGLPAALLVRDVVTGMRMGLEEGGKMVNTFKKLNRVIYRSVFSTRFISLFYCEIEINGKINFVNAGHPPPVLFKFKSGVIKELESTGLIFGALQEIDLEQSHVFMEQNDILLLYTDGIIERLNRKNEEFGIERLKAIISENKEKSPDDLIDLIFNKAQEFGRRKKWKDDVTLVVVKKT